MIRFAHFEYLYALTLVPVLVLVFLWGLRARQRALKRFGNPYILQRLMPTAGRYKRSVKFSLLLIAFGLLVMGLVNPQVGIKMEEVKREGVDVFIALDVSNSMKAEDVKPNRLESAKREITLLLDKLQNDRIGLIVFAGDSYLQLPLTTDYSAARLFLSTIDVDIVPIQGTAIGSAIRLAMKSFVEGEKKHKVIIVITDGENHEDDALAAAKDAAAEGAVVHTIGMGSPLGAPIPVYRSDGATDFKKDSDGKTVISKLNEPVLQQIADAGNGKYLRSDNQQNELDILLREIQTMEKKEFGAKIFTEYEDQFQYFLITALFFLAMESFISERKNPWFEKWQTFFLKPLRFRQEYWNG